MGHSFIDVFYEKRLKLHSSDNVKTSFIQSFEQKYSTKTMFSNFQDLMPGPGEGVYLYFDPNVPTFKRLMTSKPDEMTAAIWADNDQNKIWKDGKAALLSNPALYLWPPGVHYKRDHEVVQPQLLCHL
jgi:hypothetical protein